MAVSHLDRLSSTDASFLTQEDESSHMHIGAVLVFEGPPPPYEEFLEHVEARLHLVPRYRQKLVFPPMQRPLWVDDPRLNIEYHVRHSSLPEPGDDGQLAALTARIFSQQLDRSKPLWEMYLVQGLEGNRFALISKTHHAMVDGISGVDLATVLFDANPVPAGLTPPVRPWEPKPEPSDAQLLARSVEGLAKMPLQVGRRALRAAQHPRHAVSEVTEVAEGLGEIAWELMNPAPKLPLNTEIGPHRRYRWVHSQLADFKLVKDAIGGTVNDVVLAVVAGALRHWVRARGLRTQGLEARALVPVSLRGDEDRGMLGNRLAVVRAPLPVYADDPVERLRIVREAMSKIKQSKQVMGAEAIVSFNDFAPPTVLAQAARLNFSTRLFNLIVTNVPGPQFPLYVLGRELETVVPVAFLPAKHSLAVANFSYNGRMSFGLLADFDAMEDIDVVQQGLEHSLKELVEEAVARQPQRRKRTTTRTARRGTAVLEDATSPGSDGSPNGADGSGGRSGGSSTGEEGRSPE
jgi:WS/DGAT/MGAT family acyltransferase